MKTWLILLLFAVTAALYGAENLPPAAPDDAAGKNLPVNTGEAEIRKTVIAYCSAQLSTDIRKMLEFCSEEYCEPGRSGITITLADLKKIVGYYDRMRSSDDLEVILENALLIQGQQLSAAQKEEIAKIKKSGRDKTIVSGIKKNFAVIAETGKQAVVTIAKIDSDGQNAIAEVSIKAPDGKVYRRRCFLVLRKGKWLISKYENQGNQ